MNTIFQVHGLSDGGGGGVGGILTIPGVHPSAELNQQFNLKISRFYTYLVH